MIEPPPLPPPTAQEARRAVQIVVQQTADLLDGKLVVSPCTRTGTKSRACNVRIDGPAPLRLRVTVSRAPNRLFIIRARPR